MIEKISWPLAALAVAILAILLRRHIARFLTPRDIPGVPTLPETKPILGDILFMGKLAIQDGGPSEGMGAMAKELGPLYLIRLGFFYRILILSDYDEIERLFLSSAKSLDKGLFGRKMLTPILSKAIVALPTGDMWKHHVRIMGPAMTPKYLGLMMPRAVEAVLELVELFKAKIEKVPGRAWDVTRDMEGATMDAIWGIAFGESTGIIPSYREQLAAMPDAPLLDGTGAAIFPCKRPDIAESTIHVFESVSTNPLFNEPVHWVIRKFPAYRKHNGRLQAYLHQRIGDARRHAAAKGAEAALETAGCTLDMMVARELRGEDWMPEDEMRQELLEYLVAGTETSGVLLTWWMKIMSNHPHVQHKLRQHLLETCPEILDRPLQYEDLSASKTPYLEAVIWETLRFSKTTGGFMRETTEEVEILGHRIPKGVGIVFPSTIGVQDLSRHNEAPAKASSESPEEKWNRRTGHWAAGTGLLFQVERWFDKDGNLDANAGPSLPFGIGQRACFGRNLAMMDIRLFIAYLNINFFFVRLPESQNGVKIYEAVTRHPLHAYVRPVLWSSPEAQKTD